MNILLLFLAAIASSQNEEQCIIETIYRKGHGSSTKIDVYQR